MGLNDAELAELTRNLPQRPGAYLMEDAKAKIIYVGKAANLKKRVLSYFREAGPKDPKTVMLVTRAAKVRWLVTESEKEALILENTLIKRHRPRYNIALRDDKSYPYIKLSIKDHWPRLAIVRRPTRDGDLYFGPYVSAKAARSTLRLMNELFPLRKCKGQKPDIRTRPCLHNQMNRCPAPCVNQVDRAEYLAWVDRARAFLKGNYRAVAEAVEQEMWRAAKNEIFEEAARLRDRLASVKKTLESQVVVSERNEDLDIFGFCNGPTGTSTAVLFVRRGALVGSRNFFLRGVLQIDSEVVSRALGQFYTGKNVLPDSILLPLEPQDSEIMAEWLSDVKGRQVHLKAPQRGLGRRLLARALANAEAALPVLAGSPEALAERALEELGQRLSLESPVESMECYDISIHQGENPIGAMVRYEDGRPARSKYRNYKIKTVIGQDDTAMLAEVLSRRFSSFPKGLEAPDLVVIDGGKGQLNAALAALGRAGHPEQPCVALAKTREANDDDRLFIPGRKNPLKLSRTARLLLMNLRDETHRRAITANRGAKRRQIKKSALHLIPGVGPKRAQTLLKTLGSLKAIKSASPAELARVEGIGPAQARLIYDHLHQN